MRRGIAAIATVALLVGGWSVAGAFANSGHDFHPSTDAARPVVHVVGQPGQPAYGARWKAYKTPPYGNLSFYKDASGVVHLTGLACMISSEGPLLCANGFSGEATTVFTLPPGFRPAHRQVFAALNFGLDEYMNARFDVSTNGAVQPITPPAIGMNWTSFDGISFLAR